MNAVGSIGGRHLARLGERGGLSTDRGFSVEWCIGADDRWHRPEQEVAVRQSRRGAAPVYDTAMRVPGGDAVQRVYGIGGPSDLVVMEIANESPAPFVAGFVLRGELGRVTLEGARVRVGRRTVLVLPRVPARWAHGRAIGEAVAIATSGGAGEGAFPRAKKVAEAVFLYPVAHRARVRGGVVLGDEAGTAVDMTLAPDADDATRGWHAQLGRGMQLVVSDEAVRQRVDAARADALLEAWGGRADATLFATLEAWGLDEEAARVWRRLGIRARRRAARPDALRSWLLEARDGLVSERDGHVDLLPDPAWLRDLPGIEVLDAPTRRGRVSFALRRHADRLALLWECERAGVRLRAPALDPAWETSEPRGDALLGAAASATEPQGGDLPGA
ncbi:MAG: hypothetical protein U0V73_06555 [Acidimicrobiia bacterium]